eukprot:5841006-Pyramimonas_sp.AAC.1
MWFPTISKYTDEQYFTASLNLLVAAGSAYYRTVFKRSGPKFAILELAAEEYDEERVARCTRDLRAKRDACA